MKFESTTQRSIVSPPEQQPHVIHRRRRQPKTAPTHGQQQQVSVEAVVPALAERQGQGRHLQSQVRVEKVPLDLVVFQAERGRRRLLSRIVGVFRKL